jgi:hypothetical protein
MSESTRQLTEQERHLAQWMLANGPPEAKAFLAQLEKAEVTPWRCSCGCASINFCIPGYPEPPPGVHPIADFVFGEGESLSGIFLFENDGVLRGLEVYGLAGDAPRSLPRPEDLRPFDQRNPIESI